MKKLRGIRLVLGGCVFYLPYFFGHMVMEEVPTWLFPICAALFGICVVAGLLQIFFTRDDTIDVELEREMEERRRSIGKKGFLRFR